MSTQIIFALDHRMRCHTDAACNNKALFSDSILRNCNARCVGTHTAMLREKLQRSRRHVLELGGSGATAPSELGQRNSVEVIRRDVVVADSTSRAVISGIEH